MCSDAEHLAIKLDPKRWSGLVRIGDTVCEADGTGPYERYEHRNCTCHTTLVVIFDADGNRRAK